MEYDCPELAELVQIEPMMLTVELASAEDYVRFQQAILNRTGSSPHISTSSEKVL
jgi:hypothetical protein